MPVSAYILNALFIGVAVVYNKVITLYMCCALEQRMRKSQSQDNLNHMILTHTHTQRKKYKLSRGFSTHSSIRIICLHMWIFLANLPDSGSLVRSFVRSVRLSILFGVSFITPEWNIKKCIFIKLFITWYTTVANRRYRYHVENSKVESRKFQVKENRPETVNQVRYANKQNCATIYWNTYTRTHGILVRFCGASLSASPSHIPSVVHLNDTFRILSFTLFISSNGHFMA